MRSLAPDDAVRASWDDQVEVANDRSLEKREYRSVAELWPLSK